jgi:hypothetical protein
MPYIGNPPAERFTSFAYQDLTGGSGTSFTLNNAVGNPQEIEVFVNNVRQEPGVAYTVSGTALTMTGSIASTDDFYVVFQGKAIQTATHPSDRALTATDGTFTGDLGVGTASPSAKIHLNESGSANAVQRVQAGTNNYAAQVHLYGNNVSGAAYNSIASYVNGDSTPQWEITGAEASAEDVMILHTGGTERARLLSGGGLDLSAGHLKFDNGYGIDFSAASSASGMSSEILDDYEEGTWTATFTGSSTTATGYYVKIGGQVFVTVYGDSLNVTSSVTGTIGGLPFTNNGGYTAATITHDTYTNNSYNGYVNTGGTTMSAIQDGTVSGAQTVVGNPKYIMMSAVYYTTS